MKTQEQKALEILRGIANFLGSKDWPSKDSGLVVPHERMVTLCDDMGFGQSSLYVADQPFTHTHFGERIPNESDEATFGHWVDQLHNLVCADGYLLRAQHRAEEIAMDVQAREAEKRVVSA